MTYLIGTLLAIVYVVGGLLTARFTRKIMDGYFGKKTSAGTHMLPAIAWPVTLPAFFIMSKKEVESVKMGKDWADHNLKPEVQQKFRKEYMPTSVNSGEK